MSEFFPLKRYHFKQCLIEHRIFSAFLKNNDNIDYMPPQDYIFYIYSEKH